MKKRFDIIKTAKRAPLWALVLLAGLLFVGCTKDITPGPGASAPQDGEASVVFTVNTPKPTLPDSRSRMATLPESVIGEVKVLVFETGPENIFRYVSSGTEIASAGESQTKFKVSIPETQSSLKLVIIANSNDALGSAALEDGMTESAVRGSLLAAFASGGLQSDIPMYGEVILPDGVDASQVYNLSAMMLRAVARVDVEKSLNPSSPEFVLEEVYVFRGKDKIQVMPDALAGNETPKVTAPSVPASAQALANPLFKTVPGGTDVIGQIYIPEASAAVTNDEKIRQATTVVVGGRFGGPDSPVSYYRADFNSGREGHPFGQILRNHRYIFKIKSVTSEGWPSPEEAANNLASSILVDVQTWEDFSSEMYLGNDRLGLSSRDISLRYTRDREREIDVESTLDYQIQWLDQSGEASGVSTSTPGETISNDNFDVRIVKRTGDAEYVSHLLFRTRNHNHAGDVISDKLRITAGKWSIDIVVRQDNSKVYSTRYINILSVVGVGNLGVDMVDPGADGLAMRKILDTQFAPSSAIGIGGFSYTRINNNDQYVGTSNPNNLTVLNRIFGAQDVIYLPHAAAVSSDVADLLLNWIGASPNRVLMIGIDSDASSKQLRIKPQIADDGTFAFNTTSVTSKFMRARVSSGSDDFFDGPFGVVAEGAVINRADDAAGYIKDYNEEITPLIVADKAGNEGLAFFAVKKKNGIIYHGDAQLFQTGRLSGNAGDVSTDTDRLMANTWAWIVEQVIYGRE